MSEKSVETSTARIVVLGTGGTIAGTSATAGDNIGYTAAQVGVDQLLEAIPALARSGYGIVTEQVAQVDSKDMDFAVWQALAGRVAHWLAQDDVAGVVITHGTDTLEETALFLQAVLDPAKPVVLTCAMRPASSLSPDGPQNVLDAVAVAGSAGARGVVAVCAGVVHGAFDVQKVHTYRLDAFGSGDAGPVGYVEEGALRLLRAWPSGRSLVPAGIAGKVVGASAVAAADWPRVEIVMSHAGAGAGLVEALVAQGVAGLVVATTGNGTVHHALEAGLLAAQAQGVQVLRATRCTGGRILTTPGAVLPDAGSLSPVKARVALLLMLLSPART
ncbi:L-asparaginase [Rhodoferax koreense]|uniref:L-asparaginase n=1 Tax=Rhodoferax koreensis TaxID=1842727 RepID=A0A1P8JXN3_9BURK|nr:asparaginase [Rhodoferax koreense]APW38524.1 L-asparaginase [Rhodoferax koreense]